MCDKSFEYRGKVGGLTYITRNALHFKIRVMCELMRCSLIVGYKNLNNFIGLRQIIMDPASIISVQKYASGAIREYGSTFYVGMVRFKMATCT